MGTYSLDLDFLQPDPKFPAPPNAQIYVKTHSTEKDRHFITPKCVCFQEFDYEIRRLEGELKTIRQKARHKFGSKKRGDN
jgi:hypothetical protein